MIVSLNDKALKECPSVILVYFIKYLFYCQYLIDSCNPDIEESHSRYGDSLPAVQNDKKATLLNDRNVRLMFGFSMAIFKLHQKNLIDHFLEDHLNIQIFLTIQLLHFLFLHVFLNHL